ncbi:MAG: cell division protein SepF [Armatimonadetes bacterium]|nr:cell division protein SepF [Armatimonadota bacterium]
MSIFQTALDYLRWGGDPETEADDDYAADEFDEPAGAHRVADRREAGVHHIRDERAEVSGLSIVRADPKNMDQATAVADEIKRRRPVVLNLQAAPETEAKRIRDFIGGVTYGLNGYMRRIADWVFVCAPYDMPVERLVLDGMSGAGPRYESSDHRSLQEL